ncbi:MAG TPA: ABC transporter substrate-binding protein, partial [Anaerolineae bacterium]|nr:ABC transporter substrate-binding protein [Anaerolineae bacterium]
MRKTVANLLVTLMIVGLLVPLLAGCGPTPTPIVEEVEVPVEQTVVVTREVMITATPAPTPEPALTIIDGAGRVLTIPKTPQRIVSIASAATETLFAIGCGDEIVGRDRYSDYPPEVQEKPSVGS